MQTLENTLGFKSRFSKMLSVATLSLATMLGTVALPAHAADAELVVKAIKASASAQANSYVQATVTLATLGSAANQPKSMVAQGKVIREESTNLAGTLPLTFDAAYKPAAGSHTLNFKVTRTGRIGLQWLVNGNPLDELMMQTFETDQSPQALTKQIEWNGASRMVTVTFETKQARRIMPIIVGTIKLKEPKPDRPILIAKPIKIVSKPQKPPIIVVGTIKMPKKATGRKVTIKARFLVTNSEDGVGGVWGSADTFVELYGSIKIAGQTAFSFNGRSAGDGAEYTKTLDSVVMRYNVPEIHFTKVGGNIMDHDKLSSSDTLFNASQNIDLLQIMASNKEYLIKGDRKSESGDLYIRVINEGEVFD